jgi:predicted transcriptional regulator
MTGLFNRLQDEIKARNQPGGLSPSDLLDMPDTLAQVIHQIIRRNGMKLEDIAKQLKQSQEEIKTLLAELVQKGLVRQIEVKGETWYKAHFSRKADRMFSKGLWSILDDVFDQGKKE